MKLNDLKPRTPLQQVAMVMESYLGHGLEFNKFTTAQANHMLRRVRAVLAEQRNSSAIWNSHENADYLKLVMMEQALQQHVDENTMTPMAIDVNDPKTKATMKKAEQGRALTPDEQKTITAMAMMKKETKKPQRRMVKEQNELQQAQVVLAAQDLIDRIQDMIEDVSEMQYKDLPALAASIKNDPSLGTDKAAQFQNQATTALTELLNSLQAGKTGLEATQGVLTGQAPGVAALDDLAGSEPMGGDELDLSLDANLDLDQDSEEEPESEPDETNLGRKRR